MLWYFLLECAVLSTLLYLYLHKKTRIRLRYLYIDNFGVILLTSLLSFWLYTAAGEQWLWAVLLLFVPALVLGIAFAFTMIRFWRTPRRRISASKDEIISPADGNVIYITRVEAGEIPVSVKGRRFARLEELTKTDILDKPCWLLGINMTPFDVHKNCAPIDGRIMLNRHFNGKFLSLKKEEALTQNERNTYVIGNDQLKVGIVQIASRLVRRIDSYVREGADVRRGDWLGMIRFGSQVDVIIPIEYEIKVNLKDQIYAGKTTIAALPAANQTK